MRQQAVKDFSLLITARTGVCFPDDTYQKLCSILSTRLAAYHLSQPHDYLQLLSNSSSESTKEWNDLIPFLINGESYFFRDEEQFRLLRDTIIPPHFNQSPEQPTFTIWSAGCSTGEEAYSIAILIDQMSWNTTNKQIHIIGTDLNRLALDHAQQGIYNDWAFRTVDPTLRNRYFTQHHDRWALHPQIRQAVRFHQLNLLHDPIPNCTLGLMNVDIILCRNVLLYFEKDSTAHVLKKFKQALNPQGLLILGHHDVTNQAIEGLVAGPTPAMLTHTNYASLSGTL